MLRGRVGFNSGQGGLGPEGGCGLRDAAFELGDGAEEVFFLCEEGFETGAEVGVEGGVFVVDFGIGIGGVGV